MSPPPVGPRPLGPGPAATAPSGTRALVVVDLQAGTTALPTAHPVAGVVARAAALVASFRALGHPVALVTSDGLPRGRTSHPRRELPAGFEALVPEITEHPGDVRVVRRGWSAFTGTDLHDRLAERGVREVVVVGLATSFGVESTARSAHDLGYDVVVVADAVTDPSGESHRRAVERVLPALGRLTTAAELLRELGGG